MKILQLSTADIGGGAEKIAYDLFDRYRAMGHLSQLAVGRKLGGDPDVLEIPRIREKAIWSGPCKAISNALSPLDGKIKGVRRLRYYFRTLGQGLSEVEKELGHENFRFPGSRKTLTLVEDQPDIIHAHNLHGDYFDLRFLPGLSAKLPLVITLHDEWMFTGHCAYTFDCERWRIGCGECPDLSIYVSIPRDATAYNLQRKRRIYNKSRFYISTPSRWLADKLKDSILSKAIIEMKVINNGVNCSVFKPADKRSVRYSLGIPQDAKLLLFSGVNIKRSYWKDYATIRASVLRVAEKMKDDKIIFIAIGEDAPGEHINGAEIRFLPFQKDPRLVANYYQAADVYIHASKSDNFPTAILESLACGTPVVATAVGGITEQVKGWGGMTDGNNGFNRHALDTATGILAAAKDAEGIANGIETIFRDKAIANAMSDNAVADVKNRFDVDRQASAYLDWFAEIIKDRVGEGTRNTRK